MPSIEFCRLRQRDGDHGCVEAGHTARRDRRHEGDPARGGAKDESFVASRRLRLSGPEAQPPGIHVSVLEARLARRQAPPGLGMDDGVPGREHSAAWRRPG
jgi:hypothetical protein